MQNKLNYVTVTGVEPDDIEDVYNLEVEDNHNFAVNGGYIVHNCLDAMRYMLYTVVRRDLRSEEDYELYDDEI